MSGIGRRPSRAWRRRIGLDGNPLRRPVDRVEGWFLVGLLVLLFGVGPWLAATVASSAYRHGVAVVAERRGAAHETRAVLLETAPVTARTVRASWTGPDGVVHTGNVVVAGGGPAGLDVPIWTDATGAQVAAPPGRGDAAALAGLSAAGVIGVLAAGLALLFRGARTVLDRRRLADWQREWAIREPQWTDRR